jgi:hypothetical protein
MSPELNTMKIGRGIEPVVGFPKLGVMTDKPVRPKAIAGKIRSMAVEPKADAGKTGRMAPFKKAGRVTAAKALAEQKPGPVVRETTEKEPGGYVRLRVRVTDGDVAVLSAKSVEGPLVEGKLQGDLAYEVMLGKKRVAAGAIPDVGEKRSFPAPKGRGAQAGHFVTPLESYEINVRVPKERVSLQALPRLDLALYRVKEELPIEHTHELRDAPIGLQFEKHVREVARLKGLQPEKQGKAVAAQLRKAFT